MSWRASPQRRSPGPGTGRPTPLCRVLPMLTAVVSATKSSAEPPCSASGSTSITNQLKNYPVIRVPDGLNSCSRTSWPSHSFSGASATRSDDRMRAGGVLDGEGVTNFLRPMDVPFEGKVGLCSSPDLFHSYIVHQQTQPYRELSQLHNLATGRRDFATGIQQGCLVYPQRAKGTPLHPKRCPIGPLRVQPTPLLYTRNGVPIGVQ